MNESIITGLGTPQLSRIVEEGDSHARKTEHSALNYTHHGSGKEGEGELDEIEEEIKEVGAQLEGLYYEMKGKQDKYSEEYLCLENRRNNLKKRLIDLDYQHKTVFARNLKKNNNANSIIHQFYDKHPQPLSPNRNNPQSAQDKHQRTQEKAPKSPSYLSSPLNPPSSKKGKGSEFEHSARRARIATIESELNEEKLLREQMETLTKQLVYLKTTYSYPYLLSDYYSEYYWPTPSASLWRFY